MWNILDSVYNFLESNNISLINTTYLAWIFQFLLAGYPMIFREFQIPKLIRHIYGVGRFGKSTVKSDLLKSIDVPKSWYKHFYIFASINAILMLTLLLRTIVLQKEAPESVIKFLDFMSSGRANRHVRVDTTHALVAVVLMSLQMFRRFYESNFIQIFSNNTFAFSIYLIGYIHYIMMPSCLLSYTEGFIKGTLPSAVSLKNISFLQWCCITIFIYSWWQQYISHVTLVNLRKDAKTGLIKTTGYLLPRGGYFDLISTPNMFFEIVMYCSVCGIIHQNLTWWYITLFVIINQLYVGWMTYQWYKEKFENYPTERKAIIPYIL